MQVIKWTSVTLHCAGGEQEHQALSLHAHITPEKKINQAKQVKTSVLVHTPQVCRAFELAHAQIFLGLCISS